VKDKVVFYTVLTYGVNNYLKIPDDDLKDFVRIVRNLLFTVRQPNQSKRIEYTTNLRLPNVSEYCKFIDGLIEKKKTNKRTPIYQLFSVNEFSGFTQENISNEKAKAELIVLNPTLKKTFHSLEEHNQIQGNTSNFKLDSADIAKKIDAFLDIWSVETDNSLRIRAYLTFGDYSVMTHSYSSLNSIWYFGCKDYWNRILTASDKDERQKIKDSLDAFLSNFLIAKGTTKVERLTFLIEDFKTEIRDWRYYFIKYKPITKYSHLSLNLFTWQDDDGFDINHLGNSGNYPLHSYHLNPYLITLKHQFNSNKKVTLYFGRFTDISFIQIEEKVKIRATKGGWNFTPISNFIIKSKLITKYGLLQNEDSYILSETESKDKIEIATELINDILK